MGFGAALAVTAGTAHLFGGSLATVRKSDDEFERKEIVRRTTRIPIEQTVAELGESRGKTPPPKQAPCLRWMIEADIPSQISDRQGTKSAGARECRRSTASRSTRSRPPSTAACEEHDSLNAIETFVHNQSRVSENPLLY